MDDERFDHLTRILTTRRVRRSVVGLMAAGLAVSLSTATARPRRSRARRPPSGESSLVAQRNAECAARCKERFPPGKKRGHCISQGAHGRGP
jgi:hypothetical protein